MRPGSSSPAVIVFGAGNCARCSHSAYAASPPHVAVLRSPTPPVDPDLLTQQLVWTNRLVQVRARGAELLLAGVTGAVLLVLLAASSLQALRKLVNLDWADWHACLLALLLTAFLLERGRRDAHRHADALAHGWLSSLPWPARQRRQALRRSARWQLLARLTALAAGAIALLALRDTALPPAFTYMALALPLVLLSLSPWLTQLAWRGSAVRQTRHSQAHASPASHLCGLALLQAAWTPAPPRSWRLTLVLGLLLLPADLGFGGGLVALLTVGVLLWLGRSYARYRQLLSLAARWLAAQPLTPKQLLHALAWPLLKQQLIVLMLLALGARGSGLPALLLVLGVCAWFAWLSLSALLAFATRYQPQRYAWLLLPRLLVLALVTQALPPAGVLLWLALLREAWRMALRSPLSTS